MWQGQEAVQLGLQAEQLAGATVARMRVRQDALVTRVKRSSVSAIGRVCSRSPVVRAAVSRWRVAVMVDAALSEMGLELGQIKAEWLDDKMALEAHVHQMHMEIAASQVQLTSSQSDVASLRSQLDSASKQLQIWT